jgi:spore coat protein A
MNHRIIIFLSAIVFFFMAVNPSAFAVTITINPAKDNTMYEDFPDNSCGIGTGLFIGTNDQAPAPGFPRRALVQFDIAGNIPSGSIINSVALTMNSNRSGDNQNAPATLHPLQAPTGADWGEGASNCDSVRQGGQGTAAAAGDATWTNRSFNTDLWITPGGDYNPASATATIPSLGDAVWDSAANPAMVTDVQAWLDNPAGNYGWIVLGDEARQPTSRRFSSREGDTPPDLTVDYTPVTAQAACCSIEGDCSLVPEGTCNTPPSGEGDSCTPNLCPQPVGACCNADETCSDLVDRSFCEANGGVFQGADSQCSDTVVDCGLTPFVDALPFPVPVLQPITGQAGDVASYEISQEETTQQLHSELPPTTIWGYQGSYPGPTIEATVGKPISVKVINNLGMDDHYLATDECPHGPNYWQKTRRTVVHLHGGHVPARYDGQPEYDFMDGAFDIYEYPNTQLPSTLWFHDHSLGITRLNVYMGLAAYYMLRPDCSETPGDPECGQLPDGEFEIPVLIQDRTFNPDGSLFYPPTTNTTFFGDKILVNGKVWPFHNVKQGKYRLRLLNGSQAREYILRLENQSDPGQVIPFTLIGTDGGLISTPINRNTLHMAPAERLDVIVDFATFPAGTEIILKNDDTTTPRLFNTLKFIVLGEQGDTDPIPATLNPVEPIPESSAAGTRQFLLERVSDPCLGPSGGEWLVQSLDDQGNVIGEHWDDITEYPILGNTEIWEFENTSNIMHPMHVHLVQFQVLEKTDVATGDLIPLQPWETNTWKDTVYVPPRSRVRVIMTFEGYIGRFPYHCHILDHEDHEMMRQFQTINDPAFCDNDGICDAGAVQGEGEDCIGCSNDCGQISGAYCGNGLCEIGDGENFNNCSLDCAGEPGVFACGDPTDPAFVGCEDPRCTDGFFCRAAPRVTGCCGDRLCEGQETAGNCAVDCEGQPEAVEADRCFDDLDNDADTLIDCADQDECNGAEGGICDTGVPGICASGRQVCTEGAETCRQDIQPVAENCSDGLDNDCDGFTDSADSDCVDCSDIRDRRECKDTLGCEWEGRWWRGQCVPTAPHPACTDNDHDGYGSPGDPSCPNGSENDCDDNDSAIHPGADDSNCNGIDEDCSGTADDHYISTSTSCGTGSCSASGQTQCQSGTEVDTCTPGTPGTEGPAGEPTCSDGADNDCDGFTDTDDHDCDVVADCSKYTDRRSCKDDRNCSWDWRRRRCVER